MTCDKPSPFSGLTCTRDLHHEGDCGFDAELAITLPAEEDVGALLPMLKAGVLSLCCKHPVPVLYLLLDEPCPVCAQDAMAEEAHP